MNDGMQYKCVDVDVYLVMNDGMLLVIYLFIID